MKKKLIERLALLAILAALSSVLRIWMVALPNVKPITAMFFVFSMTLGLTDSLVIMAITMIATGLLLGFSPIILGQIIAYAIIISLFKMSSLLIKNIWLQALLSAMLAMIFGVLMSLFSGLLYGFGSGGFIGYWLSGLPFDFAHALSTFVFFPLVILIFKRIKIH